MKIRKDVHGVKRSKEFFSLVLFLETQLVDHGGTVRTQHMNEKDFEIVEEMIEEDLIIFKRLPSSYTFDPSKNLRKVSSRVEFSEEMWEIAHKERRDRAARLIPQTKKRTGEKDD